MNSSLTFSRPTQHQRHRKRQRSFSSGGISIFFWFHPHPTTADKGWYQGGLSEVRGHTHGRTQLNTTSIARNTATTTSGRPFIQPAPIVFCNVPVVCYFTRISLLLQTPCYPMCDPKDQSVPQLGVIPANIGPDIGLRGSTFATVACNRIESP